MPINSYNAMGNNRYGELTDAERLAAQQEQAALSRNALSGGGRAQTGPAKQRDPEGFTLMQMIKQFADAARGPAQDAAPSGNGGLLVAPGRGQPDAQRTQERVAGMEGAAAEEIARARLMELRQGVRENRTQSPDDAKLGDMLAGLKGPMSVRGPGAAAGQPALPDYLSQSGEGRPAAYPSNPDPEERRTQALLDQKNGVRAQSPGLSMTARSGGTAPNPGMAGGAEKRRKLYEDTVFGGGAKSEDDILKAEMDRRVQEMRAAAAKARADQGDFAGAEAILRGQGSLQTKAPVAPEEAAAKAEAFIQRPAVQAEVSDIIRLAVDAQGSTTPQVAAQKLLPRIEGLIQRAEAEGATGDDVRAILRTQLEQSIPEASVLSNPLTSIPRWLGLDLSSRGAVRDTLGF